MFRRILVATDGSPSARRAVDRAVEVAELAGASLGILCAGDADTARPVVDAEMARLADSGLELAALTPSREPATAIVEAARAGGFDLVVVGNRGMTGARRHFTLGSVPNRVSHALTCSLLVVRTT